MYLPVGATLWFKAGQCLNLGSPVTLIVFGALKVSPAFLLGSSCLDVAGTGSIQFAAGVHSLWINVLSLGIQLNILPSATVQFAQSLRVKDLILNGPGSIAHMTGASGTLTIWGSFTAPPLSVLWFDIPANSAITMVG